MKSTIDEEKKLKQLMRERTYRVVSVDLDGTLAQYDKWEGYTHIGAPNEKVASYLRKERKRGAHIVIHSCRVATADNKIYPKAINAILRWLKKYKIPADEIWTGTGKVFANLYIDDSAINPFCKECITRYEKTIY